MTAPVQVRAFLSALVTCVFAIAHPSQATESGRSASTWPVAVYLKYEAEADLGELLEGIRNQVNARHEAPAVASVSRAARDATMEGRADAASATARSVRAKAAFWLERAGDGGLMIFLVDASGERLLIRRLRKAHDAVLREEATAIIGSATEALIMGDLVGLAQAVGFEELTSPVSDSDEPIEDQRAQRDRTPSSTTAPAPSETRSEDIARSESRFLLGLNYGIRMMSSELPLHGPKLGLGYGSRPAGWSVHLVGGLSWPGELSTREVTLRVQSVSADLVVARLWRGGSWQFGFNAGPTLQHFRRTTEETVAELRPTAPHHGRAVGLRILAEAGLLLDPFAVRVGVGAQALLGAPEYRLGSDQELLLRTWWLQPDVRLGFELSL